jgi:hypothetical protein
MPETRVEAGSRPGGRGTFLCFAKETYPKERRPCCLRPLRFAAGQPGVLVCGVRRGTHCAPVALRSNNHGESDDEAGVSCGTPATPRPARPRRIQKGLGANSRTGHRVARPYFAGISASRWAGAAERSDGPYGCLDVRLSSPCWMRLRRGGCGVGMGVEAPMLRQLTRRGCPNGAAKQRSEFCGAPRNRPAAGLPRSEAKGSQTGGRPFFGDFLSAKRKKVTALPGALPGTRHPTEHATRSGPWLRQAQPERVGVAPWLRPAQPERLGGQQTIRAQTINFIAASTYSISARAKKHHKPKRPTP